MENTNQTLKTDPLGLESLEKVLARLVELKDESIKEQSGTTRFALVVEQLEDRFLATKQKYDLLKDRYSLLKRSNAALCDELVWLRDQLDDLSSAEE